MKSINFPERVIVTEQVIDCTSMSEAQKKFVIDFTLSILSLFKEGGKKRGTVGIAGPPGCGKSLLSVLAREVGAQSDASIEIVPISVDAFHYRNSYLEHVQVSDKSLKDFKGRPDTYDTQALIDRVGAFLRFEEVCFPLYSRKLHEPIEDAIAIHEKATLLLIEGGWLLYDKMGWERVGPLIDKIFYINDVAEESQAHTIMRHVRGGRTPEDAERHYGEFDAKNRELIMRTKIGADELLVWPK